MSGSKNVNGSVRTAPRRRSRAVSFQAKLDDARRRRESLLSDDLEAANLTTEIRRSQAPRLVPQASAATRRKKASRLGPLLFWVCSAALVAILFTGAWLTRPDRPQLLSDATNQSAPPTEETAAVPLTEPAPTELTVPRLRPLPRPERQPAPAIPALDPRPELQQAPPQQDSIRLLPQTRPGATLAALREPPSLAAALNVPAASPIRSAPPAALPAVTRQVSEPVIALKRADPPQLQDPPDRLSAPIPDSGFRFVLTAADLDTGELPLLSGPFISVTFLAPARTREDMLENLRLDAFAAGFDLGDTKRLNLSIRDENVRYYHPEDRETAQRLAEATGAELRDFTWFTPRPPEGTLELWASGRGGVTRTEQPTVGVLEGLRRDLGTMRRDIVSALRGDR